MKKKVARGRALEERLRIARELHDSLTHSISVISVQSGVAAHLARKRSEDGGDGSGLCQLDSLVARARSAGLPVSVTVTGTERALPTAVDQAAYRIVQEALTNVSRHAGPACASVQLHYTPDILSVQVDDDGLGADVGPQPASHGLGLLGIQMPVLDGLEATRQIVADERMDCVRVVILTNFGLDEYIFRALRAGASGFLLKDTDPAGLLQALRVVMGGDSLLSPAVTRRLISEFVARPPDAVSATRMENLTNREREVVALVAHGLSNDEIAQAMVLSPATAKTHVSRAMIKLGARDRAQLVVFAYQAGLVTPRARG